MTNNTLIYRLTIGALLLITGVMSTFALTQTVFAAPPGGFNTGQHIGFFKQQSDDEGRSVIEEGLNGSHSNSYNATRFINDLEDALYVRAPKDATQDQVGAAFIILNMLGYEQGSSNIDTSLKGINRAKAEFSRWETIVRQYESAGRVNFNTTTTYSRNTYWQGDPGPNDVAWYDVEPNETRETIVFTLPNGAHYVIKHACGNPVGSMSALIPLSDFDISGRVVANSGSQSANSRTGSNELQVLPGDSVDFNYQLSNSGDTNSSSITWAALADARSRVVRTAANVINANTNNRSMHAENFIIPTDAVAGNRYCREIRFRPISDSNTATGYSGEVCAVVQLNPAPSVSCGVMNYSPTSIDPNTPYTITTSVRYGNMAEAQAARSQPGFRYFITITAPNGTVFSGNVIPSGPDASNPSLIGTISRPATGVAGRYTVGWGVVSPYGAINCGAAIPGNSTPPYFDVTNKPFFRVNGGDISAGAGMSIGATDCAVSTNTRAGIVSWNRGSSGAYGGAGTRYGATATNHLLGFVSGQGTSYAPSRLSFGNTGATNQVNEPQELYGGKFGTNGCIADYFAHANNVLLGNRTITGGAIANGSHTTLYVEGNVYITGNITFSGNYPTTSAIPTYSIIVKGNIYIAPGVTQLDGFYISQPSSSTALNGIIYSCAPSDFSTNAVNVLTRALQNQCNNSLTVNGAFVARQVWLLRTSGSLSANIPAETFNYTPESWLSTPFGNGLTPTTTDKYDSITSLPPVL